MGGFVQLICISHYMDYEKNSTSLVFAAIACACLPNVDYTCTVLYYWWNIFNSLDSAKFNCILSVHNTSFLIPHIVMFVYYFIL